MEKYVAAEVDYQILDQKLTGPPVNTHCNIKFGQILKLLITLHPSMCFSTYKFELSVLWFLIYFD